MTSKLDDFTTAYLECALWSSTDDATESGGCPLDDNYGIEDISEESIAGAIADCSDFQEANAANLSETDSSDEQNGHDFWLTRNGHGTGFWDRGYADGLGARLTDAAHVYGSVYLYVGDDGKVYGS